MAIVRGSRGPTSGGGSVDLVSPTSAFGEVLTATPLPEVQITAVYGIQATDVETLTDTGGSATAASSLFEVTTGTSIGGYGVIRSRRVVGYNAGQGQRFRFTAAWPTPGVANCLLLAGAFTATDGLFFGYSGTSFGILRRVAGTAAIVRLTVTTGTSGAGTVVVTLNGVPFNVAAGGVLTTAELAELIAETVVPWTGWASIVSPTSNGSTVTWIQGNPGPAAGAYSISGAGAAGTFATLQAGVANDNTTGFVAQTAWNVDTLDGTSGAGNPSGMLLDKTKLNVFEIVYGYLGAATVTFRVMTPAGYFVNVHQIRYPNSAAIPSQRNPSYRLGWVAASLGSTTALSVIGASASGFSDGNLLPVRDPVSTVATFSAGTTEYVALAIRNGAVYNGVVNLRELLPASIVVGTETAARVVTVRVYLNPTITGAVAWSYVDASTSVAERATPTAITPTGRVIAAQIATSNAAVALDMRALDLRMEPGDVIAISLDTASGSAACVVAANWQER